MKKRSTTTHFKLNPAKPPKTDWTRFDAMPEKAKHKAALADPDCKPATKAQLARARRVPDLSAIRHRLDLTQEEFALKFHLSLGAVRDWEQGKHQPDHAARALLKVIAFNPAMVAKALEARP